MAIPCEDIYADTNKTSCHSISSGSRSMFTWDIFREYRDLVIHWLVKIRLTVVLELLKADSGKLVSKHTVVLLC